MSGPSLVLVPPTPNRPSPYSSRGTTPDLSVDQELRSSSETTTIDTIYSLYGEEMYGNASGESGVRGSWSTSEDATRLSKHSGLFPHPGDSSPNSFFLSTRHSTSDLAYLHEADIVSEPKTVDLKKPSNGFVPTNSLFAPTNHPPHPAARDTLVSTYTQSSMSIPSEDPASSRMSRYPRPPRGTRPPSTYRISEHTMNGDSSASGAINLSPPKPKPTSRISPSRSLPSMRIANMIQPSPLPIATTPPPSQPQSRITSSDLSLKSHITLSPPKPRHPAVSRMGSPSSGFSLVPFEGEEPDAFHVRNTYAQLEMYGVKGDGYEEGVERTRAKIGDNLESRLTADSALCDGTEKTQDINPKELETLASLDRYGFFNQPSHDRLVRLPSSGFAKRLARVRAGSPSAPTGAVALTSIPPTRVSPKECHRIAKWTQMLVPSQRDFGRNIESWTINPSKESKLRKRTYKGIPDRWRSAAWEVLVRRATQSGKKDVERLEQLYRDELEKPSTYDVQIDLDVPRTISGHIMFRTRYGAGQRSLFHVLHCFSLHCSDCGYVQGMGPIAATLLCYFSPSHVYATLLRLHTHPFYSLHTLFLPGFPGLLEAIYVQERIIEKMMPGVYNSFKKNTITTTSYATKWYITLFANTVPFQCQMRIWDAFLLDGKDVFIFVAVAIVWVYRDQITAAEANFETILSLLSSVFVPESEDPLMSWISNSLGDRKLRSFMLRWREEWKELVATGQDSTVLL